ncbi:MerR family DNA-binding transcriptional regulator [Leptodesmis sichuanensis]|nr:MerR family DNA-binding transcriptional regulator [Leptodesmis sichuanensis]UIE37430.1 MerR family DNA-binding transcriptional regulator [Leptodesmis sichuanensis A121]
MGEVSRRLAITPQMLCFYEWIRLIPCSQQTDAGYGLFNQQDQDIE